MPNYLVRIIRIITNNYNKCYKKIKDGILDQGDRDHSYTTTSNYITPDDDNYDNYDNYDDNDDNDDDDNDSESEIKNKNYYTFKDDWGWFIYIK